MSVLFASGINAAATFNRTLIRQRGAALGEEFKGKGIHVALGPAMLVFCLSWCMRKLTGD